MAISSAKPTRIATMMPPFARRRDFGFTIRRLPVFVTRGALLLPTRPALAAVIVAIPADKPRHALVDGGRRPEAMIALDGADVREGFLHVAGLHRLRVDQRFHASRLFEQVDHPHQVLAAAVADIVDRVRRDTPTGLNR